MVQIGMISEQTQPSETCQKRIYSHDPSEKYRSDSRMSVEESSDDDDGERSPRNFSQEAKTPSSDLSGVSPKSEGFSSSSMSVCGEESSSRTRAVLDLSMSTAFMRKHAGDSDRSPPYSHSLVPPYSPLSSSASMSSSSGSPSVTPEVKMDEISIHDIAKEVIDRRQRAEYHNGVPSGASGNNQAISAAAAAAAAAAASEFDLPKNFYGYYVYQLELASRFSSTLRSLPNGSPVQNPPLIGKVKPTLKAETKDDETVSYGSLLEQALRNGLKRSPSEVPTPEKKSKPSTPVSTPPPSQTASPQQTTPTSQGRQSNIAQISVEDVAKTSLREMLHSKQMQEAKAMAAMSHVPSMQNTSSPAGSHGSRSSSPSVNLKTLLETQSREGFKGQGRGEPGMAFSPVALQKNAALQQQLHQMQNGKSFGAGQPLIYPHILARPGSPQGTRNVGDLASSFMTHLPPAHPIPSGNGSFKHKKLLEWSAADVRDWISTLSYCSEFAEIFLQQSVDGVALTLLNETHLMKNFGMKLGPAIKLRCAVWEILGLCQAAAASQIPQMQMPQFLNQKQIPVGHCIPQHHNGTLPKP